MLVPSANRKPRNWAADAVPGLDQMPGGAEATGSRCNDRDPAEKNCSTVTNAMHKWHGAPSFDLYCSNRRP